MPRIIEITPTNYYIQNLGGCYYLVTACFDDPVLKDSGILQHDRKRMMFICSKTNKHHPWTTLPKTNIFGQSKINVHGLPGRILAHG